jgi:formylglycine-generating enzyme required for sulfatase activity
MEQESALVSTAILVEGGLAEVGSLRFYPEERPVVVVEVGDVWFDMTPVTNRSFADFVEDTGHVTVPEKPLDPADFPGADPELLVPGSQMFSPTPGPVDLRDWTQWWRWQPGATWRTPQGFDQPWTELLDHPVVHVGWEDAVAYAQWAGKDLPTESEWEHAARGGVRGAEYAWGDELSPGGRRMANTWAGRFPWDTRDPDGFPRTSPVGSYPANGFGLHDMIGNVWEWTRSPWTESHAGVAREGAVRDASPDDHGHSCCGGSPLRETDQRVTKGGSHLCSPTYCQRYRPAARQGHGVRDTTSHLGFRCVRRA